MTAERLAVQLADVENRAKSNTHRIDHLEQRQDNLDRLASVLSGQQRDIEHINRDVREIKGDVKSLMDQPRSRWNAVLTAVATGIAGALVGAVLGVILR